MLKIVFGIAAGFVLDVPLRRILPKGLYGGYEGLPMRWTATKNTRNTAAFSWRHCVTRWKFFVFILVFSFIIGLIFGFVGADSAAAFLGSLGIFQPMMAALIGLVPTAVPACCWLSCIWAGLLPWQFFCGAVLRRRYRPGCAVACQPPAGNRTCS